MSGNDRLPSEPEIERIMSTGLTDEEIVRYERIGDQHDEVPGIFLYLCAKALRHCQDQRY